MRVRWLGRVPYREGWVLQRALSSRSTDDYLLLLEHPHVFTLGANADEEHVLVDPTSVGADLVRVDRGGDVTYHGPGQLIGYPLVTVGSGPHRGPDHVRRVEQVVIDALVALGAPAATVGRLEGYPGVWAGLDEADDRGSPGPRKIAAIGVRTSKGRTTHGFALNVHTDLAMFGHIVPCGIPDKAVTSMAVEGWEATMAEAVDAVVAAAEAQWGRAAVQRVTDPVGTHPERGRAHPPEERENVVGSVAVSLVGRREGSLGRRLRRSGVDPAAGLPVRARKPPWLRANAHMGDGFLDLRQDLRRLELVTVCEEAGCPNIYECWSDGTATFMINGSRCTRACGFCQVDTRRPLPLDAGEP
ncbi:MAG: lipoyl(octanoyl) transferase LipB [Acidimicrobiales bacterium]